MRECVCMCTCVQLCASVCVCMGVNEYVYVVHVCACVYVREFEHVHVCKLAHLCACMYVHTRSVSVLCVGYCMYVVFLRSCTCVLFLFRESKQSMVCQSRTNNAPATHENTLVHMTTSIVETLIKFIPHRNV